MGGVLVSDFDGTMTRRDFFQIFLERFKPSGASGFWDEYLKGRITHFEALRSIFESVAPGEPALVEVVGAMELDPDLAEEYRALERSDWRVIVASAGSDWYIRRLLDEARVDPELHANLGRIVNGRLVMELPTDSRYFSAEVGIDKSAVVRAAILEGGTVAFAGDGKPDLAASLLVPEHLRFARGVLAEELTSLGETYHRFDRWTDISRALRSWSGLASK
ncbi:HAD-IB family phosphatase [Tundrisphaera lichenicola]|uniref:HAD-IB family phosphatase n=1 Tax=Tundrisphaera lichenicola TaxID=2029860 RepID=UPI003EBCBD9E